MHLSSFIEYSIYLSYISVCGPGGLLGIIYKASSKTRVASACMVFRALEEMQAKHKSFQCTLCLKGTFKNFIPLFLGKENWVLYLKAYWEELDNFWKETQSFPRSTSISYSFSCKFENPVCGNVTMVGVTSHITSRLVRPCKDAVNVSGSF